MTSAPTPMPAQEPLHGCVRCGTDPVSQAMCERCNPLGLKEPAPSQAHATVFIGIIAGVVLLAVVAKLAVSSVGPFAGAITDVARRARRPAGLADRDQQRVERRLDDVPDRRSVDPRDRPRDRVRGRARSCQPGQTLSFEAVVASLGTTVKPLSADCDT